MAKIYSVTARKRVLIAADWQMAATAAGAFTHPEQLTAITEWLSAPVPGTVALALQRAQQWDLAAPSPLHHQDYWYRTRLDATGAHSLHFVGLATAAEIWLNDVLLLRSENMFVAQQLEVTLPAHSELYICFRALAGLLAKPIRRARWRPAMIEPLSLRGVRTTLLGHMPGWCPAVHAIGPWRPIECVELDSAVRVQQCWLNAELLNEHSGKLTVTVQLSGIAPPGNAVLSCAGNNTAMTWHEHAAQQVTLQATLLVERIQPWWPHTHGQPHRYAVRLNVGDLELDLGWVGFRRIEVERGDDGNGFALKVNGVPIFCRGACWTSADIVGLAGTRAAYLPWLQLMRDANMNMVRVGGTMVYEADAFYQLCDELGVMVWQDFMFANFDYPSDDAQFAASVTQEVTQFLDRTQGSPSITVLCGGSEVMQQAAMLGLPKERWQNDLFTELLPALCARYRADAVYVANSPVGGALPFYANAGVTHYYGVGAYQRPLEDARRAEVKFAAECLAFANVPEATTLTRALPVPAVHHPTWKQRVPRDRGASWDFEDVRDHYLTLLYRVDATALRRSDAQRYLELSRAVTGAVMEAVFAEWRRPHSPTAGGLVWTFQDLWPGAGWGVVDSLGEPKAAWYALRRAFRAVQVSITDEGVNGLAITLSNDRDVAQPVRLTLTCWREAAVIISAARTLILPAHSCMQIYSAELLPQFIDINYAYRFGPPAVDVTMATLCADTDNEVGDGVLAEAFHFPLGLNVQPAPLQWQTRVAQDAGAWWLYVITDRAATSVHISDDHYRPEDNWFHLAPHSERRIRLLPRKPDAPAPAGYIAALNSVQTVRYGVTP